MLLVALLASVSLAQTAATAPTAAAVPAVQEERLTTASWPIVDPDGQPVQDPARIAVLRTMIDGYRMPMREIPPGSSLVAFTYGDADTQPGPDGVPLRDRCEVLEGKSWIGGWHLARVGGAGGEGDTILWTHTRDEDARFVSRRWGCAPIVRKLPRVKGCIIDVGILSSVPATTFTQTVHLVDAQGDILDLSGTLTLRLNGSLVAHPGTLDHGVATFPGVAAGHLVIEGNITGYEFGRRDPAGISRWMIHAAPETIARVVAKPSSPVPRPVDPRAGVPATHSSP